MPQKSPPWTRPRVKWRRAAHGAPKAQRRSLAPCGGRMPLPISSHNSAIGRCSGVRPNSVALSSPPARFFFIEKLSKLHPESLSDMPQGNNCWIPLSQFQATDVCTIHALRLGKSGLRQPAAIRSRRTFRPTMRRTSSDMGLIGQADAFTMLGEVSDQRVKPRPVWLLEGSSL
jgi:hypothetical protein